MNVRILVVEPDMGVSSILNMLLCNNTDQSTTVVMAKSRAEAACIAQKTHFTVALVAHWLNGEICTELVKQLHSLGVPTLILSGDPGDPSPEFREGQRYASGVITKPFATQNLCKTVREHFPLFDLRHAC